MQVTYCLPSTRGPTLLLMTPEGLVGTDNSLMVRWTSTQSAGNAQGMCPRKTPRLTPPPPPPLTPVALTSPSNCHACIMTKHVKSASQSCRRWTLQPCGRISCWTRHGAHSGHCALQVPTTLGSSEAPVSSHGPCGFRNWSATRLPEHQCKHSASVSHVHPQPAQQVCFVSWHLACRWYGFLIWTVCRKYSAT